MPSEQADLSASPRSPAEPAGLRGGAESADVRLPESTDGESRPEDMGEASIARITVEVMDSVSQQLSLAGFQLVRFGGGLSNARDLLTLSQIADQLDVAIAEIRRLALIARRAAEN